MFSSIIVLTLGSSLVYAVPSPLQIHQNQKRDHGDCQLKPNLNPSYAPLCDNNANDQQNCINTQFCYWAGESTRSTQCILKAGLNELYGSLCQNANSQAQCSNDYCVWVGAGANIFVSIFDCAPKPGQNGYNDICKLQSNNEQGCRAYPQCQWRFKSNIFGGDYNGNIDAVEHNFELVLTSLYQSFPGVNTNPNYADGQCTFNEHLLYDRRREYEGDEITEYKQLCEFAKKVVTGRCAPLENSYEAHYCNITDGWESLCVEFFGAFADDEEEPICQWVPNEIEYKCATLPGREPWSTYCNLNVDNEGGCRNLHQYCEWTGILIGEGIPPVITPSEPDPEITISVA
eukprot:Awhi_evm1s3267